MAKNIGPPARRACENSAEIALDIIDPKAYADGKRADEAFTFLRHEMPLAIAQPEGFDPFWVVSKYADILEVERQNDLLLQRPPRHDARLDRHRREGPQGDRRLAHLVKSLVQMDNPEHGGYRRLTQP